MEQSRRHAVAASMFRGGRDTDGTYSHGHLGLAVEEFAVPKTWEELKAMLRG
jgi:hypothetical protein